MRNYFSVVLIISFFNIYLCHDKIYSCDTISNTDDKQIISLLKNPQNFEKKFFQENFKTCIDILINKGNFDALEFLLNELLKKGIKFKDYLNASIDKYNLLLNNLKNKFKFKETDYQKVVPAIRWAQNNEYIFLEIKFSHRHDSPGCPEVEEEFFDIVNGNQILFHAYCSIGDVPIKFEVLLTLSSDVIKLRSHWGVSSAQKFHVTLKKSNSNENWEGLIKENTFVPNNLSKWFEMEEKFKVKKTEDEENEEEASKDDDENEIIVESNKKKKKRKTDLGKFNTVKGRLDL